MSGRSTHGAELLGIIGGVGPRATARLYLSLTERVSGRRDLPPLLIHSVAMRAEIEDAYLAGQAEGSPAQAAVRHLLADAIERLTAAGARCIVMPCNTLQDELGALCRRAGVRHLNMADATAEAVARAGLSRVLLLATSTTCATGLYRRRLAARGIVCVHPPPEIQADIDRRIRDALDLSDTADRFADRVAGWSDGCDAVVVGCTDLCGDVPALRQHVRVFDSLQCLAEVAGWALEQSPVIRAI